MGICCSCICPAGEDWCGVQLCDSSSKPAKAAVQDDGKVPDVTSSAPPQDVVTVSDDGPDTVCPLYFHLHGTQEAIYQQSPLSTDGLSIPLHGSWPVSFVSESGMEGRDRAGSSLSSKSRYPSTERLGAQVIQSHEYDSIGSSSLTSTQTAACMHSSLYLSSYDMLEVATTSGLPQRPYSNGQEAVPDQFGMPAWLGKRHQSSPQLHFKFPPDSPKSMSLSPLGRQLSIVVCPFCDDPAVAVDGKAACHCREPNGRGPRSAASVTSRAHSANTAPTSRQFLPALLTSNQDTSGGRSFLTSRQSSVQASPRNSSTSMSASQTGDNHSSLPWAGCKTGLRFYSSGQVPMHSLGGMANGLMRKAMEIEDAVGAMPRHPTPLADAVLHSGRHKARGKSRTLDGTR